jgi:hypothetical protein
MEKELAPSISVLNQFIESIGKRYAEHKLVKTDSECGIDWLNQLFKKLFNVARIEAIRSTRLFKEREIPLTHSKNHMLPYFPRLHRAAASGT